MKTLLVPYGYAQETFCRVSRGDNKTGMLENQLALLEESILNLGRKLKKLGRVGPYDSIDRRREADGLREKKQVLLDRLNKLGDKLTKAETASAKKSWAGPVAFENRVPIDGSEFKLGYRVLDPANDLFILDDIDREGDVTVVASSDEHGLLQLKSKSFEAVVIMPLKDNLGLLHHCGVAMEASINCLGLTSAGEKTTQIEDYETPNKKKPDKFNLLPLDAFISTYADLQNVTLNESYRSIRSTIPWLFAAVERRDAAVKRFNELLKFERDKHTRAMAEKDPIVVEADTRKFELKQSQNRQFFARNHLGVPYFGELFNELLHDRQIAGTVLKKRKDLMDRSTQREYVLIHVIEMTRHLYRNAARKHLIVSKNNTPNILQVFRENLIGSVRRLQKQDWNKRQINTPRVNFTAYTTHKNLSLSDSLQDLQMLRHHLAAPFESNSVSSELRESYFDAKDLYFQDCKYLLECRPEYVRDGLRSTIMFLACIDWMMLHESKTPLEVVWKSFLKVPEIEMDRIIYPTPDRDIQIANSHSADSSYSDFVNELADGTDDSLLVSQINIDSTEMKKLHEDLRSGGREDLYSQFLRHINKDEVSKLEQSSRLSTLKKIQQVLTRPSRDSNHDHDSKGH